MGIFDNLLKGAAKGVAKEAAKETAEAAAKRAAKEAAKETAEATAKVKPKHKTPKIEEPIPTKEIPEQVGTKTTPPKADSPLPTEAPKDPELANPDSSFMEKFDRQLFLEQEVKRIDDQIKGANTPDEAEFLKSQKKAIEKQIDPNFLEKEVDEIVKGIDPEMFDLEPEQLTAALLKEARAKKVQVGPDIEVDDPTALQKLADDLVKLKETSKQSIHSKGGFKNLMDSYTKDLKNPETTRKLAKKMFEKMSEEEFDALLPNNFSRELSEQELIVAGLRVANLYQKVVPFHNHIFQKGMRSAIKKFGYQGLVDYATNQNLFESSFASFAAQGKRIGRKMVVLKKVKEDPELNHYIKTKFASNVIDLSGGMSRVENIARTYGLVDQYQGLIGVFNTLKDSKIYKKYMQGQDYLITAAVENFLKPSTSVLAWTTGSLRQLKDITLTAQAEFYHKIRFPGFEGEGGVQAGTTRIMIDNLVQGWFDSFKHLNQIRKDPKLKAEYNRIMVEGTSVEKAKTFFGVSPESKIVNTGLRLYGSYAGLGNNALKLTDILLGLSGKRMHLSGIAHQHITRLYPNIKMYSKKYNEMMDDILNNSEKWELFHAEALKKSKVAPMTMDFKDVRFGLFFGMTADAVKQIPVLGAMHPFWKIIPNVIDGSFAQIPLVGRYASKRLNDMRLGSNLPNSASFMGQMALSEQILNTKLMIGAALLWNYDIFTGSGPLNLHHKLESEKLGERFDSIKIGDTYYKIDRLSPTGFYMHVIGDAMAMQQQMRNRGEEFGIEEVIYGAAAVLSHLEAQTLFEVAETMQLITDWASGKKLDKQGAKLMSRTLVSSVPGVGTTEFAASLIRDALTPDDPQERDTNIPKLDILERGPDLTVLDRLWGTVKNDLNKRFSFGPYSDKEYFHQDLFGQFQYIPRGFIANYVSPITTFTDNPEKDPVRGEMIRLKMGGRAYNTSLPPELKHHVIDKLDDTINVGGFPVELTNKQYFRYQQLAAGIGLSKELIEQARPGDIPGKHFKGTLYENIEFQIKNDWPMARERGYTQIKEIPDIARVRVIKDLITWYRRAASAQLKQENPRLVEYGFETKARYFEELGNPEAANELRQSIRDHMEDSDGGIKDNAKRFIELLEREIENRR